MVPVRRYWLSLLVIAPLFMCGSGGGPGDTGNYGLGGFPSGLGSSQSSNTGNYGLGGFPSGLGPSQSQTPYQKQNPFFGPYSQSQPQSVSYAPGVPYGPIQQMMSQASLAQASSSSSSVAQSSQPLYLTQAAQQMFLANPAPDYGQSALQQNYGQPATGYQNQPQTAQQPSYAPQAQPGKGGYYGPKPMQQNPPQSPPKNYSTPSNAPAQCVCPQSPSQTPPPCTTPSPSSPSSPPLSIDNLCPTLDKIMDPTLCIVNTLSSSLKQLMGLPLGLSNLLAIISDIIDEVSGFLGDSVPAVCLLLTRPVNDDTVNNFCDPLATFINNLVEILSTAGVPIQSPPDNICKLLKGLTPTLPTLPSAIPNVTPAVPTVGDTSLPPVYK